MNDFDKILADLDVEIDEIDLYGYGIIETSLSMVHRLQTVLNDLREKIQTGSNEVVRSYINRELDNLTYFFNRNLDFYQYYRSGSTVYDEYYFVRGKADLRLCTDSAQFDKDPNFSTGYDYKVAKIIANEMLRIYLNKRLQKLVNDNQIEDNWQKGVSYRTGIFPCIFGRHQ